MAKKILMIDDSVEMCEEVSEVLRDEGYEVQVAHDGIAGDALLRNARYDLVLLDLKMPGLDGFGVLRSLRQRNDDTKVVIVTARPIASDLLAAEGGLDDRDSEVLGLADNVINKPYDLKVLLSTMRDLLE